MLKINLRFVIVMILINFTTFIFAADEMKAETDPHANIYKESDFQLSAPDVIKRFMMNGVVLVTLMRPSLRCFISLNRKLMILHQR